MRYERLLIIIGLLTSLSFAGKVGAQTAQERILFVSLQGRVWELLSMRDDGTDWQTIIENVPEDGGVFGPASLSPDGSLLAVTSVKDRTGEGVPGTGEIFLTDMLTQQVEQLTNDGKNNHTPLFSPDGTRIAYLVGEYADAYFIDLATREQHLIVNNRMLISSFDDSGYVTALDWSPDGQQLVLHINTGHQGEYFGLFLVNVDGSNLLPISTEARGADWPTWGTSPDIIYYVCRIEDDQICQLNLTTGETLQLTQFRDVFEGHYQVRWLDASADDRIVFQVGAVERNTAIYRFDVQTQRLTHLTPNHDGVNAVPRWHTPMSEVIP